jgi:hypothetical protein
MEEMFSLTDYISARCFGGWVDGWVFGDLKEGTD